MVLISCALNELCCTTPCSVVTQRSLSALSLTRCRSLLSGISPQRKQTVPQQTRPAQLQVSANGRRPQHPRNSGLTGLTASAAAQDQGPAEPPDHGGSRSRHCSLAPSQQRLALVGVHWVLLIHTAHCPHLCTELLHPAAAPLAQYMNLVYTSYK